MSYCGEDQYEYLADTAYPAERWTVRIRRWWARVAGALRRGRL